MKFRVPPRSWRSCSRPRPVGLRLQHHPDARGAGQGALGRRAEPVSAPRRPHPEPGRHRPGLRQAGEGRARPRSSRRAPRRRSHRSTPRSSPIPRSSSSSRMRRTSFRARSGGCSRCRENYPDLKSNQNFLALQSQLEGTENRIAVARRDYIEAVQALQHRRCGRSRRCCGRRRCSRGNKPMAEFTATEERRRRRR